MPTNEECRSFLEAAGEAADGASKILLNYYGNLRQVSEKDQAGLVSEADRESEAFIVGLLKKKFPSHRFLGEETGLSEGSEKSKREGEFLWIIDPLDGTTNYVHQFPIFCISIGLQVAGQLTVGLVDAPKLNMRFSAMRGHGAFLNGERLRVSGRQRFQDGLFATGFHSADNGLADQFALIEDCIKQARGIRRAGAAAMDLCFVAQGIYDVFWERNLQAWDTAAGALIAAEAGATVTNFEGEPYTTQDRHIIAGNPYLHAEILARIRRIRARS